MRLRSRIFKYLPCVSLLVLSACQPERTETVTPPQPKIDGSTVVFPPASKEIDSFSVAETKPDNAAVTPMTGRLTWSDDATVRIYTPVSGRVVSIKGELGYIVKIGDELARIDSPDFGQSQSDAIKAQSDVTLAEKVLARDQDLLAHGAAAQKDVEADAADLESKKAELQRALSQLAHYGGTPGQIDNQYILKAPIAGTIVEKNINPGQQLRDDLILANVQAAYQPLFVISDPDKLWLFLDVTEDDQTKMSQGQALKIHTRTYPDRSFQGTIENVGQELDPSTRTLKVRATVDNSAHLLRTEMYVNVELANEPSGGVTIPSAAIFHSSDGAKTYVFIEHVPGDYEQREVTTGAELNGQIAVSKGLELGDRIVVDGALRLANILQNGRANP